MFMTTKELIKELKKMPPDAEVLWCDHDTGPFSDWVRRVTLVDFDNVKLSPDTNVTRGEKVILRS